MTRPLYTALVHHPVRARDGSRMTSAVTNVDVHDIARSARTYGLEGAFIVTPIGAQREVVERILEHWRTGAGVRRVPERTEALQRVHCLPSVEACVARITEAHDGVAPQIVVTEARPMGLPITPYVALRDALRADGPPALLLLGTAHGLHEDVLRRADVVLEPISGVGAYNHLSVRAAAAITFDRLRGAR